ncbi:hypothetical protein [Paenibacillus aquistagni]|uniref:hypothetical protein n=1 Tax=Paenibacillus aquistagni TaxID=1852522 RepID=UPI000B4FD67F|nr:hypothetical protein [Paenibacillus aquistagni]
MRGIRRGLVVLSLFMSMLVLNACGEEPADFTMFMMAQGAVPSEITTAIQDDLTEQYKDQFTIQVVSPPMYNIQRLLIEYAANKNSLIILPKDDIKAYSRNGGHIVLDSYFDQEQYAEGVMEGLVEPGDGKEKKDVLEEHLYALPVSKLPFMEKHGVTNPEFLIAIPANAPNVERSVEVLKMMIDKQ